MRNFLLALLLVTAPAYCLAAAPGFLKERMGTLSGQILIEQNKPLAGGIVSFFNTKSGPPPLMPGGGTRVPDSIARVDNDGRFNARLVPGTYYLGARFVAEPGKGHGPPKPGEKLYFVVDEKKKFRTVTIKIREVQDVGKLSTLPPELVDETGSYLTIEGTIIGPDGKPFPEAVALVKKDPRSRRPDFVSQFADKDGRFTMLVPEGTYYLMARQVKDDSIMGQPSPGSHVGTYGVDKPPADGIPGSSGPAGGISPPTRTGPRLGAGPTTGISAAAGVDVKDAKPVTGKAGEVIKGLKIKMFQISRPTEEEAESYFKVTGTVQNSEGKPVAGMLVHAKKSLSEFRPPFTSNVTDATGSFQLQLPTGTKYYLLAKPATMGPPKPGAPVGFYGLQKPIKELLVFLTPDSPEYEEYFSQAKTVTEEADATVKDVVITVYPFGVEAEEGMISLPGRK